MNMTLFRRSVSLVIFQHLIHSGTDVEAYEDYEMRVNDKGQFYVFKKAAGPNTRGVTTRGKGSPQKSASGEATKSKEGAKDKGGSKGEKEKKKDRLDNRRNVYLTFII